MEINLGYNADITVRSNYLVETTLEIENNKNLPNVLVDSILREYGVEPLAQNIPIEYLQDLLALMKDLYSDEYNIDFKIEKL